MPNKAMFTHMSDTPEPDEKTSEWSRLDDSEILEAMEPGTPAGTGEIADALDAPRRTITRRLNQLADEGRISRKKLNQRTIIWTKPEEPEQ